MIAKIVKKPSMPRKRTRPRRKKKTTHIKQFFIWDSDADIFEPSCFFADSKEQALQQYLKTQELDSADMISTGREVHATSANPAAYSLIGRTRASIAYEIAYFMNGTGRIEILNLDQYSDMMRRRPLSQLIGIYTTMFFNRRKLAKKLKRDERFMF